jgi:hypothetical protein
LIDWVFCSGGPMAGSVLRCEDLSGGMVTFDGAAGTIAVYMLTSELAPSAQGPIPVVDFLGEHELR